MRTLLVVALLAVLLACNRQDEREEQVVVEPLPASGSPPGVQPLAPTKPPPAPEPGEEHGSEKPQRGA
ncbi:MAG: hypothetical protein M3Z21_01230 [Pseudomonadota bacterium]|nr:hypothetical protein [Pseudomonadota bacterium]